MRVHHNTLKKATALGLVFAFHNGEAYVFRATDDQPQAKALSVAKDPKDALDLALLELNGAAKPKRKRVAKPKDEDDDSDPSDDELDEGEGDESEEGEEEGKTIVKAKYRKKYKSFKMTCGDSLAKRVREEFMTKKDPDTKRMKLDWTRFVQFAKQNGCWHPDYAKVNHGIARMSVINRLRRKIKAKETVIWG